MSADAGELWQMLVYWSKDAGGNPTGVVFAPPSPRDRDRELAAILGFRDTVFLSRIFPRGQRCYLGKPVIQLLYFFSLFQFFLGTINHRLYLICRDDGGPI